MPQLLHCKATQHIAQALTTGVVVALTLDADVTGENPYVMHLVGVNNSRITVQQSGLWFVSGSIRYGAGTSGVRLCRIRKNGTTDLFEAGQNNGAICTVAAACPVKLTVGDYIELMAYEDGGANFNTAPLSDLIYLSATYLGKF